MGRINSTQVKIRGQRFEVTDVEANIALRSEMKDIAVAYHKPKDQQDGALFGYVVPEPGSEIWKIQEKRDNNLVHTWEEHYDLEYTGDNIIKIRKNFLGWDSMITGKPIPHDEMQAWLDDTLRPFFYYRPQKVLEIGCGIGTMLWEMVPFVKHFYGIEPSQAGVRQVEVQLDRDGLGEKASLWHASADKIPELPPFEIDFVLVNSVTQYFPSLDYLRQVISDTLCRCKTQSHIVLGDIRSAPLDDLLAIDIYMHQWRENLREKTVQDLRNQAHWRHMYGTELLVDPSFFYDLQRRDPRISHVEIVPKMYPYDNELSRYRYQVILHVEKDLTLVTPAVWESPDDKNLLIANLPQRIKEFIFSDEDFLSLEKIPNRCISWATRVLEISSDPSTHHSKTLNALPQVDLEGQGWSPADLVELSNQYGLYVQLSTARQAEGGALDAVFFKSQVSNRYVIFPQPQTSSSYFQLNRNEQSTYKRRMLEEEKWKEMVQMLTTKLPPYMIPEAVYVVDKLPMTLNGKIDRKTMSRIAASDYEQKLKKRANIFGYQNETERIICYLFADFLGRAAAISPSTDFFLQGGHSLLATRLRAALQERFRIPIPMSVIFDSPTPHQLAFKVMDIQKQGRTLDRAVEKSYSGSGNLMEMSFAQFRLWFLELLSPSSARYNSGFALQFMKPVDEEVMEATIGKIAIRHDILRTIYVEVGGEPKAKVIQDLPKVKRVQIDGFALEEEVNAIIKEAMVIPFDWSVEPPFRPFLFRWGDNHILLLAQHHIISDGFSHDIWRKEISSIYPALLENEAPDVAELPIQYQDYAKWQRSEEFEEMIKSQLAYWVSHLQGSRPARFPKDFVRTSQVGPGGTHILSCDQTLKDKLNDICKEYNLTWYMLLIASFRAVHFTWTGQSDACLGNPVANRHLAELEPLLGFFVNTQVFRLKCQQGMPFPALLRHARDLALKALENQDVPFDRLVEILKPRRSAAQNPLVEMMFAFQTNETSPFFLTSDISARPFGVDMKTSRFDLEVHWSEEPGQLRCVFCYREDVFTADTIQTLGDKVMGFLQTIAEDHNISISSEHTEDDVLAFDVSLIAR
jgi:SAM-dependent methyltransferase